MRENIPHGVHPRVMAKGHMPQKASYYTPPFVMPEGSVHPYDLENFATRLIAGIPEGPTLRAQQEYWEKRLLDAYYHLYGESWQQWNVLIPWVGRARIRVRAEAYACEQPWNWTARRWFLESHEFAWSLEDLNYLIDRYPDRQRNGREQGIFVADKPFRETQAVAKALGLPTREVLEALAAYARRLDVG